MEQLENLTLAEGAQTTPNFDFLLDTPPQTALAEHRAWLKSIKHERPQPDHPFRVAVYIRYFNQTKYEDYLAAHKKQFLDTIRLCPRWTFAGFYVDEGSTAPHMESAAQWSRLLVDCQDGKVLYRLCAMIEMRPKEGIKMVTDWISREVCRLERKYNEPDPLALCERMGILVLFQPMGTYTGACKGFFLSQSRMRSITINSDLPEPLQRVIAAHELGHADLHRKEAGVSAFHDFALFDRTSTKEYEANVFAAELLLDDREVLERLHEERSFFGAAQSLRVPPELLDFKLRIPKRKGYDVIDPPLSATGSFLKDVEMGVSRI